VFGSENRLSRSRPAVCVTRTHSVDERVSVQFAQIFNETYGATEVTKLGDTERGR